MIIIKTEMSGRKLNRMILGLVLSCVSSQACSKEGDRRLKKKKTHRNGLKKKEKERKREATT